MRRRTTLILTTVAAIGLLGVNAAQSLAASDPGSYQAACPRGGPGNRCFIHVISDDQGNPLGKSSPKSAGLTASDIQGAYGLTRFRE